MAEVERLGHGYPFFIQILGHVLWKHAAPPGGPGRVTDAVLEAALPAFEQRKGHYYRQRYDELRRRKLLRAAHSVATAFRDRDFLTPFEVESAIRRAIGDSSDPAVAQGTENALSDLGFIWATSPAPGWEPGIPSLMDYIFEFAPAG